MSPPGRLWTIVCLAGCPDTPRQSPPTPCPPDSWVTYDQFAQPLIQTWCLPCHSSTLPVPLRQGAPPGVDFDSWDAVVPWAGAMVERTSVRQDMPPVGGPSPEQRELFAEWVACGMPEPSPPPLPDPCAERTWIEGDADTGVCATGNSVRGTLRVSGPADLSCVCEVGGDLVLAAASDVVSFPVLSSVGGDVTVDEGAALTSFEAPALGSVGGSVRLEGAPHLASVLLPRLATVGGDLVVAGNVSLGSLDVSGLVTVPGNARFNDDPLLVRLDLARLDAVAGDLEVRRNAGLVTIANPDALTAIGGSLILDANPSLAEIGAYAGLTSVGGSVEITGIGIPFSLTGFVGLVSIGGDVLVSDNPNLHGIYTLAGLDAIGGTFDVSTNPLLDTIELMPQLTTAGGIRLTDNPSLQVFGGAPALVGVTGDLEIARNASLEVVDGFDALRTVGDLDFTDLPRMAAPPTMYALVYTGSVTVDATGFVDAPAINGLGLVDGELRIVGNPALASIGGIGAITEVTGGITIADNPVLPTTDVLEFVDAIGQVGGPVEVANNAP